MDQLIPTMKSKLLLILSVISALQFAILAFVTGMQSETETIPQNNYPIRFGYIDRIPQWWPPQAVAAGMGVPGFAPQTLYNYFALAYWSLRLGSTDIAGVWANPVAVFGTDSQFGTTNGEIQTNLRKRYNDAGIKIMVSAFGSTELPTTQNIDAIQCAQKLGGFVAGNHLDGVDIAWIDNYAMENGSGERWLIQFTRRLRQILPNHIITHAPYAPYFKNEHYKNGGYVTVDRQVGSMINFYNVQFFNQGNTKYDNYKELFISSTGFFSKTSVKQIIQKGIPSHKIVVGKPVTDLNVINTGYMKSEQIGQCTEKAYRQFGWYGGVMYWEYFSDEGGRSMRNATGKLLQLCQKDGRCNLYSSHNKTKKIDQISHKSNHNSREETKPTLQSKGLIKISGKKQNYLGNKINYPVRFAYINTIKQWWPPQNILKGLGVPGHANKHIYNYIALAFWTYSQGPVDTVLIWADPLKYFGGPTEFGSTKDQIQKKIKELYNKKDIKILISAFGATEFPTTAGVDPIKCATKLGIFVKQNNLDGVDIDWEDNGAMEAGKGEQWLITFTIKLRQLLPNHIITHAPQGPYFKQEAYKNGGYVAVNKAVGDLIDFYNVQFYNQEDTRYNSYKGLFQKSEGYFSGTSVMEIVGRGIPRNKIVVGKPATKADVMNTGFVKCADIGKWAGQAYTTHDWYAGIMLWQYVNDDKGSIIQSAAEHLIQHCSRNKKQK